jgi:hypothetical protein
MKNVHTFGVIVFKSNRGLNFVLQVISQRDKIELRI